VEGKKIDSLVVILEQEMSHPTGITWRPSADYKKAPSLPKSFPALSECTHDLTLMAERGFLGSFIGRINEIDKIAEILGQSQKNIPLLIGASGVGKTAILEGIAQNF
jgi:ATP-dependent Clp protease ATP-binding subunit ClpA